MAKCEHFKLTKGDPNKMALCLKDYKLDMVCIVSLRQLVEKMAPGLRSSLSSAMASWSLR